MYKYSQVSTAMEAKNFKPYLLRLGAWSPPIKSILYSYERVLGWWVAILKVPSSSTPSILKWGHYLFEVALTYFSLLGIEPMTIA